MTAYLRLCKSQTFLERPREGELTINDVTSIKKIWMYDSYSVHYFRSNAYACKDHFGGLRHK